MSARYFRGSSKILAWSRFVRCRFDHTHRESSPVPTCKLRMFGSTIVDKEVSVGETSDYRTPWRLQL